MREGWQIVQLGDFCTLQRGFDLPKRQRLDGPFPLISSSGPIDMHAEAKVQGPGVATGRSGSIGAVFYIEEDYWPLNTTLYVKDFHGNDPRFIFHLLHSFDLKRFSSGAGVPTLNRNSVHGEKVFVPLEVAEQKRIVAILDEAFEGIDAATANAEKNLANARELYRSALRMCFDQRKSAQPWGSRFDKKSTSPEKSATRVVNTSTRGRAATDRVIEGELSLSVGMPKTAARAGWTWLKLTDLAKLESGHTPSRRHPEYWTGDIPWLGIKDAREHHGQVIKDTLQHTNHLGLDNSAARLLPKDTVCLSRTASVGYVVVMGAEMATSQDFVNWVCSSGLDPHFLKYLFIAEGAGFSRYSSGAVHQTIYFPEVKAFHICCPDEGTQKAIVEFLDSFREETQSIEAIYEQKLAALTELKQSLLAKAFAGELTAEPDIGLKEEAVA